MAFLGLGLASSVFLGRPRFLGSDVAAAFLGAAFLVAAFLGASFLGASFLGAASTSFSAGSKPSAENCWARKASMIWALLPSASAHCHASRMPATSKPGMSSRSSYLAMMLEICGCG